MTNLPARRCTAPMHHVYENDLPFVQNLREGPTAALEHIRTLYQTRAPGPVNPQDNEELCTCARDLLVHFIVPYKGIDPDIVAKDMRPELRRACFESEILLLFADMMADPDFLIHFSIFSLCIARCTLFLVRAWILEIDEQSASGTALMSPQSARAFFDKIELACLKFWEDRSRILSTYERDMGYALSELQGALYSILIIRARTLELDKVFVSPGMLKTTVLFWVHGHTNVAEDEEAHFSRLYLATRERTMFLLLDTFFQGSQCWAGAPRDDFESTIPPEHKDTLAEILQDIGPGRLLRAMLNTIKYSRFMLYGLQRLRDCLVACQCLYLQAGDVSFKEVYLQMPMLQALESSSLVSRSDKRVPVDARDPVEEQQTLEAYCSAWTHMSYVYHLDHSERMLSTWYLSRSTE